MHCFLRTTGAAAAAAAAVLLVSVMLGGGLFAAAQAQQAVEAGPNFPWFAFHRFWNTRCMPGAEIVDPVYRDGDYLMDYGYTISLKISLHGGIVRTVSAYYTDPQGQKAGGQRWIKLVDTMITVGTYRWPAGRVAALRDRFFPMSAQPASFAWRSSRFTRLRDGLSGWSFRLDFLETPVSTD